MTSGTHHKSLPDTEAASTRRMVEPALEDFAHVHEDRIRLTDLDFQQHVNNAALTALLSNGRFMLLGQQVRPHLAPAAKLVIVALEARFLKEVVMVHPVYTGSRIQRLGRTSLVIEQGIFQAGRCAVQATCTFVHLGATGSTEPWPAAVRNEVTASAGTEGTA